MNLSTSLNEMLNGSQKIWESTKDSDIRHDVKPSCFETQLVFEKVKGSKCALTPSEQISMCQIEI